MSESIGGNMNGNENREQISTILPGSQKRSAGDHRRRWEADSSDEDELEITPMIDMTFLLLIFFMVTTTISAAGQLQLPQATTGQAERTEGRVILVLDFPDGVGPGPSEPFTGSQFLQLLSAKLYLINSPEQTIDPNQIEATLRTQFADNPQAHFVLQASRKMPVGVVREVLKMAKQAGAKETMVAVSMPR